MTEHRATRRALRTAARPAVRTSLGVALLLLAVTTACSKPTLSLDEQQSFRQATRSHTVEGYVSEGTEKLALELDLEVEQGTVAFRVRDPQGMVRWEGELTGGGSLSDRRDLPPVVGAWRLDLQMVGATGSYEARWSGSEPRRLGN